MNTTLNQNRSLNLFIVVGLAVAIIAAVALTSSAAVNGPAMPQDVAEAQDPVASVALSADAFPSYRESEWHAIAPVAAANDPAAYHTSERTLVDPFAEYLASERAFVAISVMDPSGMAQYQQSERTLLPIPNIDPFSAYRQSEHTLVDPLAGMEIYLKSERTMTPVNFTAYQLSEWFGK